MHLHATGDQFDANTPLNALPSIRLQGWRPADSPLRRVNFSRSCVGPGTSERGSDTAATEPYRYRSLPLKNRSALNSPSQVSLGENHPGSPSQLHTQNGQYAQHANPEGRTFSQRSRGVGRGDDRGIGWIGARSRNTGEAARQRDWNPPAPVVTTYGVPNPSLASQFSWQVSQFPGKAPCYSFGHLQAGLYQQLMHPAFTMVPGFTLHPSVQLELPYPSYLNPKIREHRLRGDIMLPWNWTLSDPLPAGLRISWLWNHLASEFIPHIYPEHGPWRNISGEEIDPNMWGAPLNLSGNPPQWFSEDIDLGPPLLALPPKVHVVQHNFDKMLGTKPFYRFDPWADVRLYEINEYGKLERLEMYKDWLQTCVDAFGEEASPSNLVGVNVLHAERYYQQRPGTGHIFNDGMEEASGPSASMDGTYGKYLEDIHRQISLPIYGNIHMEMDILGLTEDRSRCTHSSA
ncbi:hypothetical protein EV426DRAFT_673673 [Tirmania nivea]|nr:hypothetical protein EV426DRAFT_673673 [Tirmania nivea]